MRPVRAIIFDLDGTLIDSRIDFKKMKTRVISFLEQSGVQSGLLSTTLLNQDIEARARVFLQARGTSNNEIRLIFTEVTKIMNQVELEAIETVQPYHDAFEMLQHVADRGYRLGIITRGCREYAEKALTKTQLYRFFNAIVGRDEVPHPKPDPEHPQLLLKRLQVSSSEALLIGDTQTDILCAYKSQMRCVWINRSNNHLPSNIPQPDYELSSLSSLPTLLYQVNRSLE